MGGQVALNVAMEVYESGLLGDVKFLGANPEAIKKGEDRQVFKECMKKSAWICQNLCTRIIMMKL